MKTIFPILAMIGGVYSALGIWFPRLRAHWKGTCMTCGPLSCAGFALFFISLGACFLVVDSVPERHRIWFFFTVMIGWILGAAGYALDARANSRNSRAATFGPLPQRSFRDDQRGWFFVAIGVFFFLMVVWIFVLHK